MARTVEQIQQIIITSLIGTPMEEELTSTSKVSLYRLFAYVVALCINTVEVLFDDHKQELSEVLATLKPHSKNWYRQKTLDFQYGYDLIAETDKYDNTGLTPDQIADSKIIKYAAVNKAASESRLVIKVATESGGLLAPIEEGQKDALFAYFDEVADAGVDITVINNPPDILYLSLRIFYNPLLMDSEGNDITSGGKPVETALTAFTKSLPFNGELALVKLVDALQLVEGVEIPQLDAASSSWLDADLGDYGTPVSIDVKTVPKSGYFKIENFDNVTYVANANV